MGLAAINIGFFSIPLLITSLILTVWTAFLWFKQQRVKEKGPITPPLIPQNLKALPMEMVIATPPTLVPPTPAPPHTGPQRNGLFFQVPQPRPNAPQTQQPAP